MAGWMKCVRLSIRLFIRPLKQLAQVPLRPISHQTVVHGGALKIDEEGLYKPLEIRGTQPSRLRAAFYVDAVVES